MEYVSKLYILIQAANGKCRFCRKDLILKPYTFYIRKKRTGDYLLITEEIYYCKKCKKPFVTTSMLSKINNKYPAYYVDTHGPSINESEKYRPKQNIDNRKKEVKGKKKKEVVPIKKNIEPYVMEKINSNAKLFISNASAVKNKVCPKCHSVLVFADMNVPIHLTNGDFYRYYVERVVFCIKCNQGYISVEDVSNLLNRIERRANKKCELRVNNMTVKHGERDDSYLLLPTLDNDIIIYEPPKTKKSNSEIIEKTNLNSTSFLYDLGYNIKKNDLERRQILYDAVLKYGKRKVADHLSFLISTRLGQENGVNRYKNAISVWQEDKNYVVSIRLEDRVG